MTLLTYPAGFGQFSQSPFCVKSAFMLAASGQVWQREDLNDPRKMPNQKLPVLRTPARLIADSDNIRAYLEDQGGDFDAGLSALQRAQSRTLIRMAEEHMYFHLVLDRWGNNAVWPAIREAYFASIPALLRRPITNGLRRSLIKGMQVQGLGRLTPADRMTRIEPDLDAVATYLDAAPFLLGDTPTAADYSVAPMLAGMAATPVETALQQRVAQDRVFTDYVARVSAAIPLP